MLWTRSSVRVLRSCCVKVEVAVLGRWVLRRREPSGTATSADYFHLRTAPEVWWPSWAPRPLIACHWSSHGLVSVDVTSGKQGISVRTEERLSSGGPRDSSVTHRLETAAGRGFDSRCHWVTSRNGRGGIFRCHVSLVQGQALCLLMNCMYHVCPGSSLVPTPQTVSSVINFAGYQWHYIPRRVRQLPLSDMVSSEFNFNQTYRHLISRRVNSYHGCLHNHRTSRTAQYWRGRCLSIGLWRTCITVLRVIRHR